MKYTIYSLFGVLAFLSVPAYTQASAFSDLVTLFVAQGIIPTAQVEKAREVVRLQEQSTQSASSFTFSASQWIEYADRTYRQGETVRGLLLLAKNATDSTATLSLDSACPVVYRIYNKKDEQVYTNIDTPACANKIGKAMFILPSGGERVFEVEHKAKNFRLPEGVYRMEMELLGYGKTSIAFTVVSPLL